MEIELWRARFRKRITIDPEGARAWGYLCDVAKCDAQVLEDILSYIAPGNNFYELFEDPLTQNRIDLYYFGQMFYNFLQLTADFRERFSGKFRTKLSYWEQLTMEIAAEFESVKGVDLSYQKFGLPLLSCYVLKVSKRQNYAQLAGVVRCAYLRNDSGYQADAVRNAVVRFRKHQRTAWLAVNRAVDSHLQKIGSEENLVDRVFEELQRLADSGHPLGDKPKLDIRDAKKVQSYLLRHGIRPPRKRRVGKSAKQQHPNSQTGESR